MSATRPALLAAAAAALLAQSALADEIIVSSSLVGGFDAAGGYSNSFTSQNYFTGTTSTGPTPDRRSFFIFGLPAAVPGGITGASLVIRMPLLPDPVGPGGTPGYFSDDASETFRISDTPFAAGFIAAPHSPPEAMSIWATLGTGTLYGSTVVTPALAGTDIVIPLSPAAVTYISGHLGGAFVIGGQVSTLDGTSPDELIFAYSDLLAPHMTAPTLVITYIPAPGAESLLVGTLLISTRRGRRAV